VRTITLILHKIRLYEAVLNSRGRSAHYPCLGRDEIETAIAGKTL
jgi:hypothetical protein